MSKAVVRNTVRGSFKGEVFPIIRPVGKEINLRRSIMKKFLWEKGMVYLLGFLFLVLAFSPMLAQTEKKYAVVKVSSADIRSAPSKTATVLYTASQGEKMEVLEDLGLWLKVRTGSGIVGFVYSSLVQVETEKVVAPAKPQQPQPTSLQPPTYQPPPSGVQPTVSQKRSMAPLYIVGGLAVAGAAAYFLFRKGGLLNKGTATLRVNSTPSPAKVYVDNEEKCETPCTVENVSPGTHTIKVVRELYGEWTRKMEVKGYQEYDINATLAPYRYEADFCFGGFGSGNGQFYSPYDLTVDKSENIYATDWGNNRLQKFDSSGNFISKYDTGFYRPSGIVFSPSNNRIYVVMENSIYLRWYTLNFSYISGYYLGLNLAFYLGIDSSGNIYIADLGNDRIVKTDANGNSLGEWSTGSGSLPMEAAPYEDNVYVSLCDKNKVKIYSTSGTEKGEFSRTINCPAGVAVDRMGHVYVTAESEDKVYKFMPNGTEILHFGSHGTGMENFVIPAGLEVLENGDVLVTDFGNHRICKWRMTEETTTTARAMITVKRKRSGGFYGRRGRSTAGKGVPVKSIKEIRRIKK